MQDAQSYNTTSDNAPSVLTEVAIVGVDLVLTENKNVSGDCVFAAHVVEINNNPAMPASEGKHMSARYRAHLVGFVGAVLRLALRQGGGDAGGQHVERGLFHGFGKRQPGRGAAVADQFPERRLQRVGDDSGRRH